MADARTGANRRRTGHGTGVNEPSACQRRAQASGWSVYSGSTELAEECAQVTDEEVGLLHGSEVTAAVELRPVHDVVRLLGEAADRTGDLPREDSQAGRRCRDLRRAKGARAGGLIVEPGRRSG